MSESSKKTNWLKAPDGLLAVGETERGAAFERFALEDPEDRAPVQRPRRSRFMQEIEHRGEEVVAARGQSDAFPTVATHEKGRLDHPRNADAPLEDGTLARTEATVYTPD